METNSFILANIGRLLDLEHYQLKWSSQQQEKGRESHSSRLTLLSCLDEAKIGRWARNLKGSSKRKHSSGGLVNFPAIPGWLESICIYSRVQNKTNSITHSWPTDTVSKHKEDIKEPEGEKKKPRPTWKWPEVWILSTAPFPCRYQQRVEALQPGGIRAQSLMYLQMNANTRQQLHRNET